jgi:KUP system potassium uptake protein
MKQSKTNTKTKATDRTTVLTLGALGVVFGDIGTSPLYALQQCCQNLHEKSVVPASVLGILSLIVWSLILVVCVKYLTFIIRADHSGEGGTLAMLALIQSNRAQRAMAAPGALVLMVLFGSALLYGDGVITPAISVLSAVEGIKMVAPGAAAFVVPASVGILVGLFLLQSRGTGTVGKLFGPVMVVWFLSIAVTGVAGILHAPQVLQALNPLAGLEFITHHGWTGFLVLGAVVLCFTGAEALFADLSHFGRLPIELGWYGLVLPALVLNYFGQGALLLVHPTDIDNPFYALVPHGLLYPMVALATLATVIASQALISGVFSLTEQAIHMGYFPRFNIVHTSRYQQGQIYIGVVNYLLMAACVLIVLGFRSSESLGSAYGLAVIGTMTVTSLAYFVVLRDVWKWPLAGAIALVGFFLLIDLTFLAGNIVKVAEGAWVPLVLGLLVFAIFWIWTTGRARYLQAVKTWAMPLDQFLREIKGWPVRQQGTGIFLTSHPELMPLVGKNLWLREHARHEQLLLITIAQENVPFVAEDQMARVQELGPGFLRVTATFGFMQHPDVTRVLQDLPKEMLSLDWDRLVCYLPETVIVAQGGWWRQRIQQIFEFMGRNSLSQAAYFRVPPREIIHVGVRLEM